MFLSKTSCFLIYIYIYIYVCVCVCMYFLELIINNLVHKYSRFIQLACK
jgi:hypothetical protein